MGRSGAVDRFLARDFPVRRTTRPAPGRAAKTFPPQWPPGFLPNPNACARRRPAVARPPPPGPYAPAAKPENRPTNGENRRGRREPTVGTVPRGPMRRARRAHLRPTAPAGWAPGVLEVHRTRRPVSPAPPPSCDPWPWAAPDWVGFPLLLRSAGSGRAVFSPAPAGGHMDGGPAGWLAAPGMPACKPFRGARRTPGKNPRGRGFFGFPTSRGGNPDPTPIAFGPAWENGVGKPGPMGLGGWPLANIGFDGSVWGGPPPPRRTRRPANRGPPRFAN